MTNVDVSAHASAIAAVNNYISEMTERLKVPVLKTGVVKATVGSNPTLAARNKSSI